MKTSLLARKRPTDAKCMLSIFCFLLGMVKVARNVRKVIACKTCFKNPFANVFAESFLFKQTENSRSDKEGRFRVEKQLKIEVLEDIVATSYLKRKNFIIKLTI